MNRAVCVSKRNLGEIPRRWIPRYFNDCAPPDAATTEPFCRIYRLLRLARRRGRRAWNGGRRGPHGHAARGRWVITARSHGSVVGVHRPGRGRAARHDRSVVSVVSGERPWAGLMSPSSYHTIWRCRCRCVTGRRLLNWCSSADSVTVGLSPSAI